MKIEDLFTGNKSEINLRIKPAIKSETFQDLDILEIHITYYSDRYWITDKNKNRIEILGIGPDDQANLDLVVSEQTIIFVLKKDEKKLALTVRLFNEKITLTEPIEIGFGDIILDDIDKRFSRQVKNNDKVKWLQKELFIQSDDNILVLINNSPKDNGFRLFGKNINIDVINKNGKYAIKTILKSTARIKPSTILIANIQIKDISSTADIRKEVSAQLGNISTNEQYLNTWKKYQDVEKELISKKLYDIGFLKIDKIDKIGDDKYQIFYIKDKNYLNWTDKISENDYIKLLDKKEIPLKYDKLKIKILKKEDGYILVHSEDNLLQNKDFFKYAIWSIFGDIMIQERRDKAYQLISSNNSPIPQLATILEGISTSSITRRKIPALTPKVKREFGELGPNPMQVEALDIALNTPDIAIIQGPPGTGKTKVITALAKRLAEKAKEDNLPFEKEVLLTAFQHDAVENMASRTTVLGLPAIKFGKKNSRVDTIDKWVKDTTLYVESQQHLIEPNDDELIYNDLKNSYINYIETLNHDLAKGFFIQFSKDYMTDLAVEVLNEVSTLTKSNSKKDCKVINQMEKLCRNIRVDSISYEDDGEFNLKRFIKKYNFYISEGESLPVFSSDDLGFIEDLLKSDNISSSDFKKLGEIKLNYLDQLLSDENTKNVNLPNKEIASLFEKLIEIYAHKIKRSGSIYSVLSEYQSDLLSNKDNVQKTIEAYSALLASTIQGSKNNKLLSMKSDPFDTVIVDEAARANPLDLNIPLTSAKRRVVLVGDHRQLPHMIDESIQNNLADDGDIASDYSSHLRDSLFERLYTKLKELEKKDGIRRVITLDTQYRMHPIIGDFISRTFYEREGDPKISSGVLAEQLTHNIKKYNGKIAASINLPNSMGKEEKYKGSTYRLIEAKESINTAKEILDEDPTLTVGVITFYSKQVDELYIEAEHRNMVERDEENNFTIVKEYAKTQNQEERFRIGSVDAFQGKEFDVVILSLVRSNNKSTVKSKYGFLTSYNRLNVAMSRAKRLLIAVGDASMFKDDIAKKSVYGLYAFYNELIGSEHGISL
jgi:superfamily I DNA and/or RNA helicase